MAVALWGDRGSQLPGPDSGRSFPDPWRSPYGATADRNCVRVGWHIGPKLLTIAFGVTEDRNWKGWVFDEMVPPGGCP
ncbi:hypothetical protein GCM10010304_83080 [Streptomyces roseoviolaceus]